MDELNSIIAEWPIDVLIKLLVRLENLAESTAYLVPKCPCGSDDVAIEYYEHREPGGFVPVCGGEECKVTRNTYKTPALAASAFGKGG